MIKFFRTIRHRLLAENRFSKYLLYAMGEIVLVVLGILIALQINDWNERRKTQQRESLLLAEMLENLQNDLSDLEYNIQGNKQRIRHNETIRKVIEQKIPFSDTLKSYFGNICGNFQLSENTAAWENLKSVGLDLISNEKLRNNLSFLYSNKYEYLDNVERDLDNNYQWNYLYPYVLEHLSMDEMWVSATPRNYDALLQDEKFYEVIKMNLFIRNNVQDQYESIEALVSSLIEQIKLHRATLK